MRWCGSPLHGKVVLFTDRSTGESWTEPSGCSVVVTHGEEVLTSFHFACCASGNNFLAEIVALMAALVAVPSNVDIEIRTDSLSSKYAVDKYRVLDWVTGSFVADYAATEGPGAECGQAGAQHDSGHGGCQVRGCPCGARLLASGGLELSDSYEQSR